MQGSFPDAIIFAATGVRINNVQDYMDTVDGFFIGTGFKRDGVFRNEIDQNRVSEFMNKVKELRKNMMKTVIFDMDGVLIDQ